MNGASTSAPVFGDAAPAPTLPQLPPMAREQERRPVRIKETITREKGHPKVKEGQIFNDV